MTRDEALQIVRERDGNFPWVRLGRPLKEILDEIDMTVDEFVSCCDQFTNKKLFVCDAKGNLVKDAEGNLTKINYDNVD